MEKLEGPFSIRFHRAKLWENSNRYELMDMNGLVVAMHWSDTEINRLSQEWNTAYEMQRVQDKKDWE